MAESLLYAASSEPWEIAEETTSAERWPVDADALRRAQDPWECPVELLPWLAYNVGVDLWYDDWDEQTKRRAIAAMPRLKKLKGTVAGIRGYLDLVSTPVTYVKAPPVTGYFGDLDADEYAAWLAKLPQLRLYPYRDAVAPSGFWDDDALFDDEEDATDFGFDAAQQRTLEQPFIWNNGAETELDLLAWATEYVAGGKIDTVQVGVPSPALSPDLEDASYEEVLFHDDGAFTTGVLTVRLQAEVIGSNSFDVAPAPFSTSIQTTSYSNVFEDAEPLEDERFYDADLVFDEDGPLLGDDTGKFYVYRRAYLLDPAVSPPEPDGDLCWDDHIWGFTPFQAIVGVDITEAVPDGDDAFCWDDGDGYFADPDTTKLDRAVAAVLCGQGGTDVIIVDPEKFKPLTFGDAPRFDGTYRFGQMIERSFK